MNTVYGSVPAGPAATGRTYTCGWCGAVSDGTSLSCPSCGATINVAAIVTPTGWVQAPGRKDMAKLQFGRSHCQIEGLYVPVADMNLAEGDGVYFAHHVLLWQEPQVKITMMPLKGAWKRFLAGMPVLMTQAKGPGHIAFSKDAPGEMLALPLQPGQGVDVREHMFLVATDQVRYDWLNSGIWFTTQTGGKDNETENHYPIGPYIDRFTAGDRPGLLLIHASGNVFIRELHQNESILIKPTALIFKDTTVSMQLHFEYPHRPKQSFWSSSGDLRYLWLRIHGPGRVAIQSAFEPVEDDGNRIIQNSPSTYQSW